MTTKETWFLIKTTFISWSDDHAQSMGAALAYYTPVSYTHLDVYKRQVLVRKLLGIETAGSLNLLFTDKTGTLTQGRLAVSAFLTGSGTRHEKLDDIPQALRDMAGFALCNNTSAVIDASDPNDPKLVGADRTEQALLRFVIPYLAQSGQVDIVDLIPFNSTRKFSATQVSGERALTLVKGAPEVILKNCERRLDANGNPQNLEDLSALQTAMSLSLIHI